MSAAKKGLGRGFDSLIPIDLIDDTFNPNTTFDPTAEQDEKISRSATVKLSLLEPNPDQPRRHFDVEALEELAASLKEHGLIQPIVVTQKGDSYQIVAGERRYRASKIAGLTEVPVIIRAMSDQHQLELSLIENIQRRDLNAVETATAYAKLRDQFNLSNEAIAARVHKSASAVSNLVRLLKLPQAALTALAEGAVTEGQVRPLIGHDEALIASVLPKIIQETWSARKVEQFVTAYRAAGQQGAGAASGATLEDQPQNQSQAQGHSTVTAQHQQTMKRLQDRLKMPVDIRVNRKGAGKLMIQFKTAEELERIQTLLG